jgi:hypothetical protein
MDPMSKVVLAVMAIVAVSTILSVLIERDQRREEAITRDDDLDPRDAEPMGAAVPFPRSTAVPTDRASRRADLEVRTHRAESRVHAVRLGKHWMGNRDDT